MTPLPRRPKIGLALGSGSARGWAHIGVLKALDEAGIVPDVICGSSVGALIGASYASGKLDEFTDWVLGLDRRQVFRFMDFRWGGGMIKGNRLLDFLHEHGVSCDASDRRLPFAAVATDLHTGAEVWLREGLLAEVVRASIALPGLFSPVQLQNRWLLDGGLVNPVPVTLARAMGADIVIAVDLNADILDRSLRQNSAASVEADAQTEAQPAAKTTANWPWQEGWRWRSKNEAVGEPSFLDVATRSIHIMQMRITRSRLAGDPPELLIAPRLAHLGLLDFHRAQEAIDVGYTLTQLELPNLQDYGLLV